MTKTAYIKNYGCQMNVQDSLHMKGLLSRMGYQVHEEDYNADLVILVTCSVREKAVQKVYSDLGRIRPFTESNPGMIVALAGCVAQQEKEKLFKRFPFLDLVFGPDAIAELPGMVEKVSSDKEVLGKSRVLNTKFRQRQDFEFVNLIVDSEESPIKAFVNIQKGCDHVCSYCIVPRVRGAEVSRPSDEIVSEIQQLVEMGVQEVTLLGQNVNAYGLKKSKEMSFVELLKKIDRETKLKRLRFTTSHPKDVGDDLVQLYGDMEMLCPHFHLPVQSGSNRILEAMRREYTREHYLKCIEGLKKIRPDMALGTDIIVGFPNETDEDFNQTLDLMDEVQFDSSFSFVYSRRPGTSALRLEDSVSDETKSERLEILQKKQREISALKNQALIASTQEVLVESVDEIGHNGKGRTGTNKIVHFQGTPQQTEKNQSLFGKCVPVKITQANPHSLLGDLQL